jgi:FLVCR family MFS transporter 7
VSSLWAPTRLKHRQAVANPFGGALASVLGPLIVTRGASDIPKLLLVAAIISTVAAPTCLLVQAKPPTPPSPAASIDGRESLWAAVHTLARFESRAAKDFAVVFVCFSAAMSAFDATTTLLSQIFGPEGYSDDASGFFGAAMILAGLLAAGIVAPVLDWTALGRRLALLAKILIPIVAISCVPLSSPEH